MHTNTKKKRLSTRNLVCFYLFIYFLLGYRLKVSFHINLNLRKRKNVRRENDPYRYCQKLNVFGQQNGHTPVSFLFHALIITINKCNDGTFGRLYFRYHLCEQSLFTLAEPKLTYTQHTQLYTRKTQEDEIKL